MNRRSSWFFACVLMGVLAVTVGCGLNSENPVTPDLTAVPTTAGRASLSFSVGLAPQGGPQAALLVNPSGVGSVSVDVTVNSIDRAQPSNPVATRTQQVQLVDNEIATITIGDLPVLPTYVHVHISNGSLATTTASYSHFIGAADLIAGPNTIRALPRESNYPSELVAHVVSQIMYDGALLQRAPASLAAAVGLVVAGLDRQASTVRTDAVATFAARYPHTSPTNTGTGTASGTATGAWAIPSGYTSVAFPATASSITVTGVAANSNISVVLVNYGAGSATVSVGATSAAPSSLRGPVANVLNDQDTPALTEAQAFQAKLRRDEAMFRQMARRGSLRPETRKSAPEIGSTSSFLISGNSTENNNGADYTMPGVLRAVVPVTVGTDTRYVCFWFDQNDNFDTAASATFSDLASYFQTKYPDVIRVFGDDCPANYFQGIPSSDINCLYSSKIKAMGFFWAGDLLVDQPGSNKRKLIYMNYKSTFSQADNRSTLIHEFQHMIFFYQRHKATNGAQLPAADEVFESFLNEAFASYAEFFTGLTLTAGNKIAAGQIKTYIEGAHKYSLATWGGGDADYGKAYVFSNWLVPNYGVSGSVLPMVSSNKSGMDMVANFCGLASFTDVINRYALAIHVNNSTGGMFGVKDVNLTGTYNYAGEEPYVLGGAARLTASSYPYTSANIEMAPWAVGGVYLGGFTGNATVNVTLPTDKVTCFQLLK